MTSSTSLPEEILLVIVGYLDGNRAPVSRVLSNQVPSEELFRNHEPECDLKAFSLVCRDWRRIVFPFLFKYVKVDIDEILWSDEEKYNMENGDESALEVRRNPKSGTEFLEIVDARNFQKDGFFAWAQEYGLSCITSRILLYAESRPLLDEAEFLNGAGSSSLNPHDLHVRNYRYLWILHQLLCLFDPESMLIVANTFRLATIMSRYAMRRDAWAYDIGFQAIELRTSNAVRHSRHEGIPCPPSDIKKTDVMNLRDWNEMEYHGGSCLNVYGSLLTGDRHRDHYFEKVPPCILANNTSSLFHEPGAQLTTFTYRCLFPHYIHFARIMRRIQLLSGSLKTLCLQLAPSPDSTVLDDTAVISRGHFRLRDCWMEVEKCYDGVVHDLLGDCWRHEANDQVRVLCTAMPFLTTFVSHDCATPMVRHDIEKVFEQRALAWKKKDLITWTLQDDPRIDVDYIRP